MDVIVERCAGLDVAKESVVVCVRVPGPDGGRRSEVRTFATFTGDLEGMVEWLGGLGVTEVVMEATGQYWKPVWYVLEAGSWQLRLVNARHVKMVPGRKTDVADAQWLAELLEHGLLRGSFVPPPAIRELRDLTRYRKKLIEAHTSETQRVQKVLEDAGIKLDSVASDVLGVSGRAMLAALVAGERDPVVLAELAKGRLRSKLPQLREALRGRFNDHHALLLRVSLGHLEHLEGAIAALDAEIDRVMVPFVEARDRLDQIPGVGKRTAEALIAEIGVDMSVFPTAAHLASWAGFCPANNISGAKRRPARPNKANRYLAAALTEAAWAARNTRGTYLSAQFHRVARRRGSNKAAKAVGHSILVAAWHMLHGNVDYLDLGHDWFTRQNTEQTQRRAVRQLEALGYHVTLQHTAA